MNTSSLCRMLKTKMQIAATGSLLTRTAASICVRQISSLRLQQSSLAFPNFFGTVNTSRRFFALDAANTESIEKLVRQQKVVVFMKGEKDSPRCGFSNAVTQILRMHGVDYTAINVLADDQLRQGIKEYSQWPTIPQVFVDGEFIGGCDILMQMHQNGELVSLLARNGIKSALVDAVGTDEKSQQ